MYPTWIWYIGGELKFSENLRPKIKGQGPKKSHHGCKCTFGHYLHPNVPEMNFCDLKRSVNIGKLANVFWKLRPKGKGQDCKMINYGQKCRFGNFNPCYECIEWNYFAPKGWRLRSQHVQILDNAQLRAITSICCTLQVFIGQFILSQPVWRGNQLML